MLLAAFIKCHGLIEKMKSARSVKRMAGVRAAFLFFAIFTIFGLLAGCGGVDPIEGHRALTAVFDGVPDLPPVEVLCEEYMGDKYKEFYDDLAAKAALQAGVDQKGELRIVSSHPPYAEKNCGGCHNFKATNLLIRPKDQLCYVCHKDFVKGPYVHGPIAVADCLACHVPHDSKHPALLQQAKSTICNKCHHEERLAAHMHEQVIEHQMECVDFHDPHSGFANYFLK